MYTIHKKTGSEVWMLNETTKELTKMKLIRSHSELGNFYSFNSILSMPYQRKVMFDMIQQYNTLGIDKEELIKENKEILEMLEKREQGYEMKIYSKIATITNTAKSFWDYQKSSMLISALLIIPENQLELIGIFDQEKAEENIKLWSKDSEMLGFFLNVAQQKCNNLTNKFEIDTSIFLANPSNLTESQTSTSEKASFKNRLNKLTSYFKK
jgi:hypothetical protein